MDKKNIIKINITNRKYQNFRNSITTSVDFDINKIFQRDSNKCRICGENDVKILQLEHLIPISKGGINSNSNCYLICRNCHKNKGTKMPWDFYTKEMLDYLALNKIIGERLALPILS